MATHQDAELILKLYDLRREETMREARKFILGEFHPGSIDDVKALFTDLDRPERGTYYRMVTSYWDMAAAMVNHGAIDAGLFFDTSPEAVAVWTKVSDLITELRDPQQFGPSHLTHLERYVQSHPRGEERARLMKERFKQIAAQLAAQK
ncbi:MAG TPA: hypothetical protein VFC61_09965 [Blastocatellia bacterium]|nr:hypothetical protein [Blastocatellia bacterium]